MQQEIFSDFRITERPCQNSLTAAADKGKNARSGVVGAAGDKQSIGKQRDGAPWEI